MKDSRAKANNDEVGQLRYRTFKLSIDRIISSIYLGYYLKATFSVWFYLFDSNNILFYKYDKNGRDKKAY